MSQIVYDSSYTQNRELSWLKFNQRVLEEAEDECVPLMERMKFISIATSNLDEFFMIRVGSITDLSMLKDKHTENKKNMLPNEELAAIYAASAGLLHRRDKAFVKAEEGLKQYGIQRVNLKELDKAEKKFVDHYFNTYIEPVLSPQIIDPHHPFPHLINKLLYVAVLLKDKLANTTTYGIIPVPTTINRILLLPQEGTRYCLLEKVIAEYAAKIFKQYTVLGKTVVSVTRNADLVIDGSGFDADEDFSLYMKKILKKRTRLAPVRLEVQNDINQQLLDFLMDKLHLSKEKVFKCKAPLDCSYVFSFKDLFAAALPDELYYAPFTPQISQNVDPNRPMIEQVLDHDLLLSYPYETMDDYIRMIKEAANDPCVVSIKITIYRLAKKAKLIKYLCDAAENGKEVSVLMELRARFDEENNINWAESLEESGCRVMYGFEDYKVHSKITCITRMSEGSLQTITQIGTGNYNENTAKMYTDFSLITADERIGRDALHFFNNMAMSDLNGNYEELLAAPNGLKNQILEKIDLEIMKVQMGQPGMITMKFNSLTDREIIDKFAQASAAGVKIRLIIRGICCILPNIAKKTENILVTSIVGRYLEHSRIYAFGEGDDAQVYIASADMMTRNTEKRVEIAAPIKDVRLKRQIWEYLNLQLQDNVKARVVDQNGDLKKKVVAEGAQRLDSQQRMMELAVERAPEKLEITEDHAKKNKFMEMIRHFLKQA